MILHIRFIALTQCGGFSSQHSSTEQMHVEGNERQTKDQPVSQEDEEKNIKKTKKNKTGNLFYD